MADFGTVKLYKSSEGYGFITAERQHIYAVFEENRNPQLAPWLSRDPSYPSAPPTPNARLLTRPTPTWLTPNNPPNPDHT
ncbi:MAG: hypothetical protein QOI52_1965 [Chloroflexota bacterium]|jgi:hypothetical protein|nr:hypothetical protein [Chloroflexota bacterium]